jgi:heme o synthase
MRSARTMMVGHTSQPVIAGITSTALAFITLLKPRVTILLTAYGGVAALVAAGGDLAAGRLLLFAVLGLMASGGAACLNHLFERDIDARMKRTRNRPLPTGRITPRAAARFAVILLGISLPAAWLTLGSTVALLFALGAAIYGGLYTLVLKRRTPKNIVIGGLAGSCGALAGWAVADPSLSLGAWLLATVVFLWTPPHFWGLAIARDADYRAANLPMLPQVAGIERTAQAMVIYAGATWMVSLAAVPFTDLGATYGIAALILGGLFTFLCVAFWRLPTPVMGMKVFKSSGAYLGLLLIAMSLDIFL